MRMSVTSVLALVGPDPDAVAVQSIADVVETGPGVVMVNDGQGVGMGHGTHRSLAGLGQPRCGHAAGLTGRVPGRSASAPVIGAGRATRAGSGAAGGLCCLIGATDGSVGVGIEPCRPLNERPFSGYFVHRRPMLPQRDAGAARSRMWRPTDTVSGSSRGNCDRSELSARLSGAGPAPAAEHRDGRVLPALPGRRARSDHAIVAFATIGPMSEALSGRLRGHRGGRRRQDHHGRRHGRRRASSAC